MNEKGIFALMGMLAVVVCIVVSVLAQPTPIANVTTANEETIIFDTGPSSNPYPAIAGGHKGTITPTKTLNVSKVFTYPCEGTGGHSEYVWIHGNGVNETVTWGGYSEEWHKLTFNHSFLLAANKTYYYEIKTGSYPQIHHRDELAAEGGMGIINCTSFVDAIERSHDNWIPAIRLEGYFVDGVHNIDTGENFSTIQAAIEDSDTQDGHTIEVDAGTYVENVVVTKRLTLRGIGMPTVDANSSGSAITVSADGCVVDGLKVTGGSSGIQVTSDGNTLSNNTVSHNYCGIRLWKLSNNTLINNIVHSNNDDGILMYGSRNNTVAYNNVTNNQRVGITLETSGHNIFTNNIVSNNKDGFHVALSISSSNIITNNTISSNSRYGIYFLFVSENHIYHNNFEDNTIQAYENNQYIPGTGNAWDNGSIEGGNYWSDHECSGNPSNGSQPYQIPGIPGSTQDRYPFEEPLGGGWVLNMDTGKIFSTIQAAIDDSNTQDGHIIVVYAGIYEENVNVTKRLTLRGIGMPTIDANGLGSAITIIVDDCMVEGFKVTGANTDSESDCYVGINVTSDGNTLINNMAFYNDHGIILWNSSNNILTNNIATTNTYSGILLKAAIPTHGGNTCSNNTLRDNTVTNNQHGIQLDSLSDNVLMNNTVSNNTDGISVYFSLSQNNVIIGNTVISNKGYGIRFADGPSSNKVYHNILENNTNQAYDSGTGNSWDNGSVEGGNYWSDHECTGNPSNGSQPYYIPSGTQDRYPFADPLGWGSVHNRDTGKNFLTIQAAIDDPDTQVGHTIEVDVGTYVENIVITKRLILRGIGMPTVDANGAGSAITVSADGCVVEGFNMTGGYDAGIKVTSGSNMLVNNTASNNNNCGIMLRSASNNTLTNNVVSSNGCGISIDYSPNNYIIDNRISDNEAGIELIMGSSYNNITNNTIFSNKVRGIRQTTPQLPSATSSFVTFARTGGLNIPQKSSNNILKYDILYSSSDYNSDYLTIANNNISYNGNGMTLSDSCNNNNITGNIVSFNTGNGISLHGSSGNKLRNNILRDNRYNFGVWSGSASGYYQDIDTSNTVNGKPIYYLVEKSDLTSDITLDEHTNAGYVGIISCHNRWHNITVKNLNLTNNRQGILVVRSSNMILDNNTVQNNEEGIYLYKSGYNIITSCNVSSNAKNIYLYYSSSNNITGNSISKGRWGIWLFCGGYSNIIGNNVSSNGDTGVSLYSSPGNNIIANTVSSNGCYGIDLRDSSNNVLTCNTVSVNGYSSGVGLGINLHCSNKNILYHNNLINNTKNGRDIEKDNLWDKGSIVGGNYWSDHECTGNPSDGTQPYISHRSVDHYPFEDPWGWDKE